MRIILSLDEELLEQARSLTGLQDASAVVNESLKALIARESARRLALLGGTEPELKPTPRRRPSPS